MEIPHEFTETNKNHRSIAYLSLFNKQRKKSFLWQIVTGNKKLVLYNNPKQFMDKYQRTINIGHKMFRKVSIAGHLLRYQDCDLL